MGKNKRNRNKSDNIDDQIRAYRGFIPWSRAEYDWALATLDLRRKNMKGNLPLTEEYAHLKEEMTHLMGRELHNFNIMLLISEIFHQRYPDEIQFMAHSLRFHGIHRFLREHDRELTKMGLVSVRGNKHYVEPQLIESLCTLPYSRIENEDSEDISFHFLYDEVIKITRAKMNAPLN
jgi:hypothetical protein